MIEFVGATDVAFVGAWSPDQARDDYGRWTSGGDPAQAEAGVRALSAHADPLLAAHGYRANPLAQEGGPSEKVAWTGAKERVESALVKEGAFPELLARGTEETVGIDSLRSYQTWTNGHSLEHHLQNGANGRGYHDWRDRPAGVVYRHEGTDWVIDGNNRLAVLKLGGAATARVVRIGGKASVRAAAEGFVDYRPSRDPEDWFQAPGMPLTMVGAADVSAPSRYRLSKFAAQHAADLVDAPKRTRDAIRNEVRKALKNGEGPDGIADRLFEVVDKTPGEIQRIAETEYVIARTGARLEQLDASGADGKEWTLGEGEEGCPICQALDGQVVALDEMFEFEGEEFDGPPAHPNCHCDVKEADAALLKAAEVVFVGAYDPEQARDDHGRWTDGETSLQTPEGSSVWYKGMYPYDWTQETKESRGPVIAPEDIHRSTELPSFDSMDAKGTKIRGFFTHDPTVASYFAEGGGTSGAVYRVEIGTKSSRVHTIDAKGRHAGEIQFGSTGRKFREIARSGKYDVIVIKNTKDEGHIAVALPGAKIRNRLTTLQLVGAWDPDQPRDEQGRWAALGASLKDTLNHTGGVFYTTQADAKTLAAQIPGSLVLKKKRGFVVSHAQHGLFGPEGFKKL